MCFVSYPLEIWLILTEDVEGNSVVHFLEVLSLAGEGIENEIKKILFGNTIKLKDFSVLQSLALLLYAHQYNFVKSIFKTEG